MVDRKAPKPQASATKLCYAFEVAGRISGANFDMVRAGRPPLSLAGAITKIA